MTVQTVGPADPNAGLRAKVYAGVGAIGGIATFLQTIHLLTDVQAASITAVGGNITTLLTSLGLLVAAFKTRGQVKNGTFEAAPEPPPAMSAVEQVKAVQDGFTDFTKTIADGVQLVQGVAASIPGLSAVVQPGSLVDQFLGDSITKR